MPWPQLRGLSGRYGAGHAALGGYFGVHGALDDWLTAYFYDNLFLYTGNSGGWTALPQHSGGRCGMPCLPPG